MNRLLFAAAALMVLTGASAVQAETLGACVWSHLPAASQTRILTAYERGMRSATDALQQQDLRIMGAAPDCAGRADLPALWVRSAVAAHVIQTGAAAAIMSEKNLDRARLDATWAGASDDARNCTLANAAKVFGIDGPTCTDRRAPETFVSELGLKLSVRADRRASQQALIYMNAKAQELIALGLISHMRSPHP